MAQRQVECVVSPKETFRWTTPFFDLQFVEIKSKKPRSHRHHSRSRSRGKTSYFTQDKKPTQLLMNGTLSFFLKDYQSQHLIFLRHVFLSPSQGSRLFVLNHMSMFGNAYSLMMMWIDALDLVIFLQGVQTSSGFVTLRAKRANFLIWNKET